MPSQRQGKPSDNTIAGPEYAYTPFGYISDRYEMSVDPLFNDGTIKGGPQAKQILNPLNKILDGISEQFAGSKIGDFAGVVSGALSAFSAVAGKISPLSDSLLLASEMVDDGIHLRNEKEVSYFLLEIAADLYINVTTARMSKYFDKVGGLMLDKLESALDPIIDYVGEELFPDTPLAEWTDRDTYRLRSFFPEDSKGRAVIGDGSDVDIRTDMSTDLRSSGAAEKWFGAMAETYGIDLTAEELMERFVNSQTSAQTPEEKSFVMDTGFFIGTLDHDRLPAPSILFEALSHARAHEIGSNNFYAGLDGDDTITVDPEITDGLTLVLGGGGADTIAGGQGSDIIDGGAGADLINAGSGDDFIFWRSGNDTVDGGGGHDALDLDGLGSGVQMDGKLADYTHGYSLEFSGIEEIHTDRGNFNDILKTMADGQSFHSYAGDDVLEIRHGGIFASGGTGDDVFRIHETAGGTMDGGEGFDNAILLSDGIDVVLKLGQSVEEDGQSLHLLNMERIVSGDGDDTIYASDGMGSLREAEAGAGHDAISFAGSQAGLKLVMAEPWRFNPDAYKGTLTDLASGQELSIRDFEEVSGSEANDYFRLGDASMTVSLMGGDDIGRIGRGVSEIHGGDGNDSLYGIIDISQSDLRSRGNNRDVLDGGSGDDYIRGGKPLEHIIGGDGNDILKGQRGDQIDAGAGHDTVSIKYMFAAKSGSLSIVDLGDGNDTFIGDLSAWSEVHPGSGSDTILGNDRVTVTYGDVDYSVTAKILTGRIEVTENMPDGQDTKDLAKGVEDLIATDQEDTILVNANDYITVDARGGDDIITIRQGGGTVKGGAGDDVIDASSLALNQINPRIYGNDGDDRLLLANSANEAYGGAGSDEIVMTGLAVKDVIDGGAGTDLIWARGNEHYTTLAGGEDADVFVFRSYEKLGGFGGTITDFNAEEDTLFLANLQERSFGLQQSGDNVIVSVGVAHLTVLDSTVEDIARAIATGDENDARDLWLLNQQPDEVLTFV